MTNQDIVRQLDECRAENARLRLQKEDWVQAYETINSLRLAGHRENGEPSREWLRKNLRHHLERGEQAEAKSVIVVAKMALNSEDYDWMIEPIENKERVA